jgi:hypothetical protein
MKATTTGRGGTSRKILSVLMDTGTSDFGGWTSADLGDLLDHQLRTLLSVEVEALILHTAGPPEEARAFFAEGPYRTFQDVLREGAADDDALQMVKGYAKTALAAEGMLPKPVARFLYVAAILRATAIGRSGLSSLDPVTVERDARHLLTSPWLSPTARDLLRAGLAR